MNAFQLAITAIIAVALLYIATTLFAPAFFHPIDLGEKAGELLVGAQSNLGESFSLQLTMEEGSTLYARNLDSLTRTVNFACTENNCCTDADGCVESFTNTGDRIIANRTIKTDLTARCLDTAGLHACTVYIGNTPAQLAWKTLSIPQTVSLENDPRIVINGVISNIGETPSNEITITAEIIGTLIQGENDPPILVSQEETLSSIDAGKEKLVVMEIPITISGTREIVLTAFSEDGGKIIQKQTIEITGNEISLCSRDTSQKEDPSVDGFENLCRLKRFCNGCNFTFECRDVWEKEVPATGGAKYDTLRGEPGFTYVLYPEYADGTC